MQQESAFLARLDLKLDALISSPFLRAAETAAIVQEICRYPGVVQDARLASGAFNTEALQDILSDRPTTARVMLAGHEPDFSIVVQHLCGAIIDLKKGGLAYVETARPEAGYGILRWLLTPSLLIAGQESIQK